MGCPFCDKPKDVRDCIFYEKQKRGWFAFLSAPPHIKGHAIIAAKERNGKCPQGFDKKVLEDLGIALFEVVEAMSEFYNFHINDIIVASLRGNIRHFHFHLLPIWPEEEQRWRDVTGYKDSHLMEFIGSLEKRHDFEVSEVKNKDGKSEEDQRLDWIPKLSGEIMALKRITGCQ